MQEITDAHQNYKGHLSLFMLLFQYVLLGFRFLFKFSFYFMSIFLQVKQITPVL